jgi:hypothetical protein
MIGLRFGFGGGARGLPRVEGGYFLPGRQARFWQWGGGVHGGGYARVGNYLPEARGSRFSKLAKLRSFLNPPTPDTKGLELLIPGEFGSPAGSPR